MKVTTVAAKERIGDLARRVFGDLREAQLRAAEAALLKANPHLDPRKVLKAGVIVIVPRVPGLDAKASTARESQPGADRAALVAQQLEEHRERLLRSAKAELQDLKAMASLLKSAPVRRLIDQFQLKDQAALVERAIPDREALANESEGFARKTMVAIQDDLKRLSAKLG
jgi:hypothetical protein